MHSALSVFLFLGSFTGDLAAAAETMPCGTPCGCPVSLADLEAMDWCALSRLYRQSPVGDLPEGFARGIVIYPPSTRMPRLRTRLAHTLWKGKVFHPDQCEMINQWSGFRAVTADLRYGTSKIDGRRSIVTDYRGSSPIVWRNVRDELREVGPGLYLGLMVICKGDRHDVRSMFALQLCAE